MVRGSQSNTVEEIKSRCNIVDVIGKVVTLKKAGNNYKGLCPFHNEKTPSFFVSEGKQIFTCFGCGASGDVISFAEKYYNLDFRGAVEMLAREYGIEVTSGFGGSRRKNELYEINRKAAKFFYKALREKANPGYTYMRNRGISDETLNQFGIGYADGQWQSLLDYMKAEGVSPDRLVELGLASVSKGRYYDKFRDRVIFPIINTSGKVIGFGGRVLGDGNPKYLNSPESAVFQKKNNLYGLNLSGREVSREDQIILVEGYMDVISLYQAGVRNVAASLGTALTENQAALIKRYTKNVVLSYDADEAGQNAAMRGIDILYEADCRARVLKVTDGKDPDEFIKTKGRRAFAELMDSALLYGDFKLDRLRQRYDMDDPQARMDFMRDAIGVLRQMKPVEADIYIKKLAEETGISEHAIRMEYSTGQNAQPPRRNFRSRTERTKEITEEEMTLLKLMMLDERFLDIPEDVQDLILTDGYGEAICRKLRGMRDDPRPIPISQLEDETDPDLQKTLRSIDAIVIPEEKEDIAFRDCIAFVRKKELRRQEQEISWKLSLAEENASEEEQNELMRRMAEIQKQLKGQ